jgi:hypothetical protein
MVNLFSNIVKDPYFDHLISVQAQLFTDIVVVVERIKQAIRVGRFFIKKKRQTGVKPKSTKEEMEQ